MTLEDQERRREALARAAKNAPKPSTPPGTGNPTFGVVLVLIVFVAFCVFVVLKGLRYL